ncbi:uncharacterized protein LOC110186905 [Drosophila serrata]|uniref:uncharacterized protein LOC110186905 n=1 Tax=Drosophila serrata TaxID=7274 RepID=UPI000A1D2035|nr:uncharacterized protein LOC110186905 [Drosophila serrata]
MTFISLIFVALLAFSSLGLPQAEETCGTYNSDIWKEDAESSEGSCSATKVSENIKEKSEGKTEATESSFFDIIQSVINFVLMIFKWFTNMNDK